MSKYPRWIVIYYIRTQGSDWLGKGVEFFDEEEPARQRGRTTQGTSRPFYAPYDRQYLGAAQGYAPAMSLTDYLQEHDAVAKLGFSVSVVETATPP